MLIPKELKYLLKYDRTQAQQWLNQLGYTYRDIKKDVFVDGHERANVVEDSRVFLKTMLDLDPYLVEFDFKGNMKNKVYPNDCQVGVADRRRGIVITHDEYTFSANDGKSHGWKCKGDIILCPKGKGRRIMVSDFLLSFSLTQPISAFGRKQDQFVKPYGLSIKEALEILEYRKNSEGY